MQTRLYNIALSVLLLGVLCVGEACGAQDDKVQELDELSARIQRREQGVTDQDVARVLTTARELGRPFTAEAAVKSYMLSRPEFPANLLLMAAENALLAGDFRVSVSRYKNYLLQAAPGRESSDAAAMMLLV